MSFTRLKETVKNESKEKITLPLPCSFTAFSMRLIPVPIFSMYPARCNNDAITGFLTTLFVPKDFRDSLLLISSEYEEEYHGKRDATYESNI